MDFSSDTSNQAVRRDVLCRTPEDVFLIWLLRLPDDADIGRAAEAELARIDAAPSHANELKHLRRLFTQAAEGTRPRHLAS